MVVSEGVERSISEGEFEPHTHFGVCVNLHTDPIGNFDKRVLIHMYIHVHIYCSLVIGANQPSRLNWTIFLCLFVQHTL